MKGINSTIFYLTNVPIKINSGIYLAIIYHPGNSNISSATFFTVTGYKESGTCPGHKNKFFKSENFNSNNIHDKLSGSPYSIFYNPVTCEIKLDINEKKEILLIKFF